MSKASEKEHRPFPQESALPFPPFTRVEGWADIAPFLFAQHAQDTLKGIPALTESPINHFDTLIHSNNKESATVKAVRL
jgi:hypothetical protein